MNTTHGPLGVSPKTAEEINIAEAREIGRWKDCRYCRGHYVGVLLHEGRCPLRPAAEVQDEAIPAGDVPAGNGIINVNINEGNMNGENNNNINENEGIQLPPVAEEVVIDYGQLIADLRGGLED